MAWKKESRASRRARVALQLRDKNGKWIEMGGGVKWFKDGKWGTGTADRFEGTDVVVKQKDGSEVAINSREIEPVKSKATLPGGQNAKAGSVKAVRNGGAVNINDDDKESRLSSDVSELKAGDKVYAINPDPNGSPYALSERYAQEAEDGSGYAVQLDNDGNPRMAEVVSNEGGLVTLKDSNGIEQTLDFGGDSVLIDDPEIEAAMDSVAPAKAADTEAPAKAARKGIAAEREAFKARPVAEQKMLEAGMTEADVEAFNGAETIDDLAPFFDASRKAEFAANRENSDRSLPQMAADGNRSYEEFLSGPAADKAGEILGDPQMGADFASVARHGVPVGNAEKFAKATTADEAKAAVKVSPGDANGPEMRTQDDKTREARKAALNKAVNDKVKSLESGDSATDADEKPDAAKAEDADLSGLNLDEEDAAYINEAPDAAEALKRLEASDAGDQNDVAKASGDREYQRAYSKAKAALIEKHSPKGSDAPSEESGDTGADKGTPAESIQKSLDNLGQDLKDIDDQDLTEDQTEAALDEAVYEAKNKNGDDFSISADKNEDGDWQVSVWDDDESSEEPVGVFTPKDYKNSKEFAEAIKKEIDAYAPAAKADSESPESDDSKADLDDSKSADEAENESTPTDEPETETPAGDSEGETEESEDPTEESDDKVESLTDLSAPLTPEEEAAVVDYKQGANEGDDQLYVALNDKLRKGQPLDDQLRDLKFGLDDAIKKGTLKEDTPVFRDVVLSDGMDASARKELLALMESGSGQYSDSGFMSTSSSEDTLNDAGLSGERIRFNLVAPAGTNAIDVQQVNGAGDEHNNEVLFGRETLLNIDSVEKSDDGGYVAIGYIGNKKPETNAGPDVSSRDQEVLDDIKRDEEREPLRDIAKRAFDAPATQEEAEADKSPENEVDPEKLEDEEELAKAADEEAKDSGTTLEEVEEENGSEAGSDDGRSSDSDAGDGGGGTDGEGESSEDDGGRGGSSNGDSEERDLTLEDFDEFEKHVNYVTDRIKTALDNGGDENELDEIFADSEYTLPDGTRLELQYSSRYDRGLWVARDSNGERFASFSNDRDNAASTIFGRALGSSRVRRAQRNGGVLEDFTTRDLTLSRKGDVFENDNGDRATNIGSRMWKIRRGDAESYLDAEPYFFRSGDKVRVSREEDEAEKRDPSSMSDDELRELISRKAEEAQPKWMESGRLGDIQHYGRRLKPQEQANYEGSRYDAERLSKEARPYTDELMRRMSENDSSEPVNTGEWNPSGEPSTSWTGSMDEDAWRKIRDTYVAKDQNTLDNNASLRSEKPSRGAKAWGTKITKMAQAQKLDSDADFYRGIAADPEMAMLFKPGTVFTDKGSMSTDESYDTAAHYLDARRTLRPGTAPVLLNIRAREGDSVADVQFGEFVFPPNTRLFVTDAMTDSDGVRQVTAIANPTDAEIAEWQGGSSNSSSTPDSGIPEAPAVEPMFEDEPAPAAPSAPAESPAPTAPSSTDSTPSPESAPSTVSGDSPSGISEGASVTHGKHGLGKVVRMEGNGKYAQVEFDDKPGKKFGIALSKLTPSDDASTISSKAPDAPAPSGDFTVGQRVTHPSKHGGGTVKRLEGNGEYAQVEFDHTPGRTFGVKLSKLNTGDSMEDPSTRIDSEGNPSPVVDPAPKKSKIPLDADDKPYILGAKDAKLYIGAVVIHPKFGRGRVVKLENNGQFIRVMFDNDPSGKPRGVVGARLADAAIETEDA